MSQKNLIDNGDGAFGDCMFFRDCSASLRCALTAFGAAAASSEQLEASDSEDDDESHIACFVAALTCGVGMRRSGPDCSFSEGRVISAADEAGVGRRCGLGCAVFARGPTLLPVRVVERLLAAARLAAN